MTALILSLLLFGQPPDDPDLAAMQAARAAAEDDWSTILRMEAADSDRVVLCALSGDPDLIRCFRSTETTEMRDGIPHLTAMHVEPADYDLDEAEVTLASILAAERAWLDSAP